MPNQIYHVYNRGNNKQRIFFEDAHYRYFLRKLEEYLAPHCDILAYTLMPNHFHLLIHANEKTNIPHFKIRPGKKKKPHIRMSNFSWGMKQLLSSYAKMINKQYNWTGSIFQQNTRSKQTSSDLHAEDYSVWCFLYIHANAKKAGIARSRSKYQYSSYKDYISNNPKSICNLALGKQLLCLDENEVFTGDEMKIPEEVLKRIDR